jgi:hypothetical protein
VTLVTHDLNCDFVSPKAVIGSADSEHMMISDEQARLAAAQLRAHRPTLPLPLECRVPRDVIEAAVLVASRAPDLRSERIAHARARLDAGPLDPHEVAEMMLSRIVGDALR